MKKDKHWAVEAQEAIALLAEQSALLTLKGIGLNEQVKQLKKETNLEVTRTRLIQLKKHPRYHEVIKQDALANIETGKIIAQLGCAELAPDCLATLRDEVKKANMKAIEIVLKVAFGDNKDKVDTQQQAVQIILATDVPKNSV